MAEEDLLAFARALGKVGRGFIQGLGGAHEMWERVAEVSGRPVLFNTVGAGTDQHGVVTENWKTVLNWIHDANGRGNRIFGQAVTQEIELQFTMEDWNLFDFSPVWREATVGTAEERLAKLSDPERRRALKQEYDNGRRIGLVGPEGIPDIRVDWVHDFALKERDYEGRTIREISQRENKHPIDAFLDLVIADQLKSGFSAQPVTGNSRRSQGYIDATHAVATDPYCIPGISDGGAHTKFMTGGTYATDFLVDIVREQKAMTLEDAHWHLSALPAMAAGFRDRGCLREGMPADIIVYDFDNLNLLPRYRAYDYPAGEWRLARKATGYRWTLVNGQVTFVDGEPTGATAGALLRHGSARGAPLEVGQLG
jgi:N-acyl-D-aspartate/D-glutamate deacylase